MRRGLFGRLGKLGLNRMIQPNVSPPVFLTQWKIVGNSEVHTLPYPDGVVLPTGYRRCKYLEFHGTEYLNTGVKTNNGIGMSLTFSTTTESKAVIGARVNMNSNILIFSLLDVDSFLVGYGFTAKQMKAPVNTLDGQLHTFTLSNTQCTLDNINIGFTTGKFTTPNANDIYIGTWNNNGTPDNRFYEGKIYSVRLYGSNVNLFNGIPCLDDNNTPCLYDTVSGTSFYNDGTGTFGYEIEPQPTEIWSCGEYNATDEKYHILVQPLGGSIADIALDEPLRKVNNVADSIEFPSDTEGKALVTRNLAKIKWNNISLSKRTSPATYFSISNTDIKSANNNILSAIYPTYDYLLSVVVFNGLGIGGHGQQSVLRIVNDTMSDMTVEQFRVANANTEIFYQLNTPTTELVDAPQIAEADSYSMVISQGGKAVEWSSFETD